MRIDHTDDIIEITDRWGSPLDDNYNLTAEEAELLPMMHHEDCFISRRAGWLGVLLEIEFDDGREPSESDHALFDKLAANYPEFQCRFTQGEHIFNERWAFHAFAQAPFDAHRWSAFTDAAETIMYR